MTDVTERGVCNVDISNAEMSRNRIWAALKKEEGEKGWEIEKLEKVEETGSEVGS